MADPGPAVDAARVIADLRELDRRTGGEGGARRVAWGEEWRAARAWFAELAGELGLEPRRDAAGNVRFTLAGEERPGVAVGSHLDSVPAGGWLDGALGAMAGLGVVRAWAESGERPPRDLVLVDWADEEGARFGYSLFGSSAFAGTLDADAVAGLRDHDGVELADALAENGVELAAAGEAGAWRGEIGAYLELHIEQGPVLEAAGLPVAAVDGCVGIERHRLRFTGQASHAGTTPMELRHDAGLAAAETALAVERIAKAHGGRGTAGELSLRPGIITAVAGGAELGVDLRHGDAAPLARMRDHVLAAAEAAARVHGSSVEAGPVFRIGPTRFDPELVVVAREACRDVAGTDRVLTSGALHDAANAARVVPAAMVFVASRAGLSHAPEEDSAEADLTLGIEAFGMVANRALRR
ncbi:MAG TPA: Zn-dependent hydrolase [Solirubrobacterales bacterium]